MNPKNWGSLDNHKQEPELPLPQFIEKCYLKTFMVAPEKVVPLSGKPHATTSKPPKEAPAESEEGKAPSPPAMDVSTRHPVMNVAAWAEVTF